MKKLRILALIAGATLVALSTTGCSPKKVDAGKEGVIIDQPIFMGHEGVRPIPVHTGATWLWWSSDLKEINIKPFNIDEIFDDLVTSDNTRVDFKIHLIFQHQQGQTPLLVKNFGPKWYKNNISEPLRGYTRAFTKKHNVFEMISNDDVANQLKTEVVKRVRKLLIEYKIPTDLILATVGRVTPPKSVILETEKTTVQQQRVKTNTQRVKAEESRKAAEVASAAADKAYMQELGLSSTEYLRMKELDNQRAAIDGKAKVTLIMGGGVQPMVEVGK